MADFSIQKDDRLPAFQTTLTVNGQPLDLKLATSVAFVMRPLAGGTLKVNAAAAVIVTPAAGVVRYDWAVGDTDTVGSYQAQWKITWPGSKIQRVPTLVFHTVDVTTNLG
jgi:hypothetical protein